MNIFRELFGDVYKSKIFWTVIIIKALSSCIDSLLYFFDININLEDTISILLNTCLLVYIQIYIIKSLKDNNQETRMNLKTFIFSSILTWVIFFYLTYLNINNIKSRNEFFN